MTYTVVLRDDVTKLFLRLDPAVRKRIGRIIDRLADNPRPGRGRRPDRLGPFPALSQPSG